MKSNTLNSSVASPEEQVSAVVLRVNIGKEHVRHIEFYDGNERISIYHLYPTLADWMGKEAPDKINPRSHDEECLRTPVAAAIEHTIINSPEDFFLENRGETLLADSVRFRPESGFVEIVLTDPEDMHGLADGATTDAVIRKVQDSVSGGKNFRALKPEEIPPHLRKARVHVEVVVGVNDRNRIGALARARNTSRQVKSWSMSDFEGAFDWIRDVLEREHGPFAGRVGYEENAGKDVTILDVLSLLTLFHQEYDRKGENERGNKAPTVAYSSKGQMDMRLKNKELLPGYMALAPIMEDILRLHDVVHIEFEGAYGEVRGPNHKLGKRQGVTTKEVVLPLTGSKVSYDLPSGMIFPLLASLRVLVKYEKGKAQWVRNPSEFFHVHRADLVETLIDQVELLGGNPQTAGKKKAVYTAVHSKAKNLLADDLEVKSN